MGAHAGLRRLLPAAAAGLLATMLALLPAPPAHASIGGSAEATAVRAQAPEIRLEVSATGAVAAVQPILDRLTRDPVLPGRVRISAEAATPPAPEGSESQVVDAQRIPGLVSVAQISAATERIQDGELSATARTGPVTVGLLGLDVLAIGAVQARAVTHPSDEPAAHAREPQVQFFGRAVPVPAGEPVDIDEYLSTADALAALEAAFPGLQSLVSAVGGAVEAGGGVHVQMGRSAAADPATGHASATGFYAAVALELDARICVPDLSGGCVAEVTIRTDATVLDLVLAETAVERPEQLPVTERIDWAVLIPALAAVALVLFALGLLVGRMRRKEER